MINLEQKQYLTREEKLNFLKDNSQYLDNEDIEILNLIEGVQNE